MRVVFMGTPDFAVGTLKAIIEAGHDVAAVVTQPDKPKGRSKSLVFSPVKEEAVAHGITVLQPERARDEAFVEELRTYNADVIVVVAFGQLLPASIINMPRYGCINVHASLLPKYRGGAPIHWAIMNGDKETGITIMKTTLKMDAGDIIKVRRTTIGEDENLESLYSRLSYLGRDLLLEVIPTILNHTATYTKQNNQEVSFALNVSKEEMKIDFTKPMEEVFNKIRGLSSIPGAYCYLEQKRLKIYKAIKEKKNYQGKPGQIVHVDEDSFSIMCLDGALKVLDIGIEGKKRCLVKDYLNGIKDKSLLNKVLE